LKDTPGGESGAGTVRVKALGFLSTRLPGGRPVDLPVGSDGCLAVREAMRLAGLPEDEVFVIIVNGRKRVTADHLLARGDEVTFVPPVAGG